MKGFCFYLFIAANLLAPIFVLAQSGTVFIKSPNNNIFFTIESVSDNQTTSEIEKLVYSVSYPGNFVIDKSTMSLKLNNKKPLGSEVRIVSSENSIINYADSPNTGQCPKNIFN